MATHSSILAWKVPRTEELVGYSPWGLRALDTTKRARARAHKHTHTPAHTAMFQYIFIYKKGSEVKVTQSCPTLCDPVDYTVHGILQVRILEWVAFPFSRGSSQSRD